MYNLKQKGKCNQTVSSIIYIFFSFSFIPLIVPNWFQSILLNLLLNNFSSHFLYIFLKKKLRKSSFVWNIQQYRFQFGWSLFSLFCSNFLYIGFPFMYEMTPLLINQFSIFFVVVIFQFYLIWFQVDYVRNFYFWLIF